MYGFSFCFNSITSPGVIGQSLLHLFPMPLSAHSKSLFESSCVLHHSNYFTVRFRPVLSSVFSSATKLVTTPTVGDKGFPDRYNQIVAWKSHIKMSHFQNKLSRNRITVVLNTLYWGLRTFYQSLLTWEGIWRGCPCQKYPISLMYECRRTFTNVLFIIPGKPAKLAWTYK